VKSRSKNQLYFPGEGPLSSVNISALNRSKYFGKANPKEILDKSYVSRVVTNNSKSSEGYVINAGSPSDDDDCSV